MSRKYLIKNCIYYKSIVWCDVYYDSISVEDIILWYLNNDCIQLLVMYCIYSLNYFKIATFYLEYVTLGFKYCP